MHDFKSRKTSGNISQKETILITRLGEYLKDVVSRIDSPVPFVYASSNPGPKFCLPKPLSLTTSRGIDLVISEKKLKASLINYVEKTVALLSPRPKKRKRNADFNQELTWEESEDVREDSDDGGADNPISEFEIIGIIGHRLSQKRNKPFVEYRVEWKNYSSDDSPTFSWVSEAELKIDCQDFLEEYHESFADQET
jgi:hypothetical protein